MLEIKKDNNRYFIEGDLNYKSLQEFNEIFQSVFNDNDEVTINIDGLRSIDRHGVNAIARLHNEAVLNGKLLTIIGLGNKEVHKHLDRTDAA